MLGYRRHITCPEDWFDPTWHRRFVSAAAVYVFDSSLDNHDRAVVHNLCKKFGLTSKSHGCRPHLCSVAASRTRPAQHICSGGHA